MSSKIFKKTLATFSSFDRVSVPSRSERTAGRSWFKVVQTSDLNDWKVCRWKFGGTANVVYDPHAGAKRSMILVRRHRLLFEN